MAEKTKKKRFAWVGQVRDNYRMTREVYPSLGWLMLGMFVILLAVGLVVGFILGNPFTFGFIGASLGLLAAMFYFSRKAMSAAYRQVEDQPGGAAAVIQSMRGGKWSCTPAVSVTKNQDMVHRVVGRPGVVLVSEGPSSRVRHMLTSEKKRTQRFIPDTPILELEVGTEPDQVPIAKLQKQLGKLPKSLTPAEANAVRHKLEALTKQPAGMPKGYMPKSAKAAKAQMRGRQR